MSNERYRIVDTVSSAHFSLDLKHLPQIGEKISLDGLIVLTVVEFNVPNSLVVTSNGSYEEVIKALNGRS